MLGYYAAFAVAAGALLVRASAQPHEALASEEVTGTAAVGATLTPGQASASFPSTDFANFRTITQDTLTAAPVPPPPSMPGSNRTQEAAPLKSVSLRPRPQDVHSHSGNEAASRHTDDAYIL